MKKPAKSIILIIFLVIPSLNSFSDNNTKISPLILWARAISGFLSDVSMTSFASIEAPMKSFLAKSSLALSILKSIFVLLSEKEFNEGITRNIINIIDFAGFFINSLYLWKIPIAFMILLAPFT